MVTHSSPARRALQTLALGLALAAGLAVPAQAAHRARLSADLADRLAAGAQAIDVIVHGDRATVDAIAARYNIGVRRYLKSGAVLRLTAGQLAALQQDETIDHLSGDLPIQSSMAVTNVAIGADQVWNGIDGQSGFTGTGIGVAVIDSGIDAKHNALKKRVIATVDFTGGDGTDGYGHGTHVAAIIAGQPGRTDDTRDFRGVASGAWLLNLRVLGNDGSGTTSSVMEAIDWAVDHQAQFNIRVINLSLGAPVLQPYRDDPLCEAVERAARAGIVVVAAAGNHGQTSDGKTIIGGITSPGNSPFAITVGAVDTHGTPVRSDDTLAAYSSRGPTAYDLVLKPDVVAPGSHIVSAEASNSYLATNYPQRHVVGNGPNAYIQLSGTSMAAGVVSGAVALLLQERPAMGPGDVRLALQFTSSYLPTAGLVGGGAGSVNVLAADQLLQGDPTSTAIAGESIDASQLVFAGTVTNVTSPSTVIWGNTVIWGSTVIWGNTVIWGDTVIWGNTVIWGSTVIWGNTVIWGDTVIWGNATASAANDTVIWGSTVIWGENQVSSATDTVIWGSVDLLASSL